MRTLLTVFAVLMGMTLAVSSRADQPWTFSDNTRYLALGDSMAAGYGAMPVTQGYTYRLYQQGAYDKTTNTLFANAAVPGATSTDVLAFQVPQVPRFHPHVITISVGGNDILQILNGADPATVLALFQINLQNILCGLHTIQPEAHVYINNLYDVPQITSQVPGGLEAILATNDIIFGVAQACGATVADVYSAFSGRTGLLLIERNGAGQFEVHPTNAGYREIAAAYMAVRQ